MFGAPVGMEHAIRSEQVLAETAMAPAKQRLLEAQTYLKEDEAAAQKRFAATAIDPKAGMWGIAAAAVNAGLPNAYKIANTASQMDARRIQGDLRQLRGEEIQVQTRARLADEKARLLTGVTDDASLQAAMQDFERTTRTPSGLLRNGELIVPYSPELVGRERALAISSKDAMIQDYRERALTSADAERVSKQHNRDFWQNMENQFERETARQRARAGQHGARDFLPNSNQISAGADFLAEKFGVDSKEPWTRVLGRELIENAKRMRNGNPAISAKEALQQSFQDMDRRGSFAGKSLMDKKEDKFRPKELPYTSDGKPDKDKLIAGQLYRDEAGAVREWSGKSWSSASKRIRSADEPPYQISDRDAAMALGAGGNHEEDPDSDPDDDEDD